ncbi:MAG: DUF4091 domain-containing protein, partial [Eubacteriales bacterium]
MNFTYGTRPETFKLTTGNIWMFNPACISDYGCSIGLSAMKNDTAAFQLIISGDAPFALNVGSQAYFSQHGQYHTLRLAARAPYPVKMNIVDMHIDDDRYYKADALLSAPILEMKAGEARAVFVEMTIPADAEAANVKLELDLYEGVMFEREKKIGSVCANVSVADYVMHGADKNKLHLDLWQHSCNIARKAEVAPWSDEHFAVLENYVRSLGELGQKAVTCIVSEAPWAGQSCMMEQRMDANLFEYSIIAVTRRRDGSFAYDYTAMQRYIDICAKYSIDREISLYGLAGIWANGDYGFGEHIAPDYPDRIRLRYLDESDGAYKYMDSAAQIDAYIISLEQYFIRTGQIEKVRLAADEPADIEAYRATLAHLHSIAPSFRFKAAINHTEFISEFGEEVYDFAPSLGTMCEKHTELKHYMDTMEGKRFLYYVCCGPEFPNTFLCSPLVESLYLGVLASYAGMDGFLRWNYTVWNDDPRSDLRYGPGWHAGDTNFVYPAKNGAPLLTLRYKELKRGIQLYELLELLKANGTPEQTATAFSYVIHEKDILKFNSIHSMDGLASTNIEDYTA